MSSLALPPDIDPARAAMPTPSAPPAVPAPASDVVFPAQFGRAAAHRTGLRSVAPAQAFQFEGIFRQTVVIGELIPKHEAEQHSDLIDGDDKSVRGLRWEEIDGSLILRHVTSKRTKEVEVELKLAPMALDELQIRHPGLVEEDAETRKLVYHRQLLSTRGPVIVLEKTRLPFTDDMSRRNWRKLAAAVGILKTVFNWIGARARSARRPTRRAAPRMTKRPRRRAMNSRPIRLASVERATGGTA